jgi:hypothetical protein
MLFRSIKKLSPCLSHTLGSPFFVPISNYRFSSWTPDVPKHMILLDKSTHRLAHPIWDIKEAEKVKVTHREPRDITDRVAYIIMRFFRTTFDFFSGYKPGMMTEVKYLRRFIFLETVAGVPGMIGGMKRHMRSLGRMKPDGGWIHHLLEEAENERMHLFTFIRLRNPGVLFRAAVLGGQAIFIMFYGSLYILFPKIAHRFIGYLEEEAVKTYTGCIKELEEGKLPQWKDMPAPPDAIKYFGLDKNAMFKQVLVAIRADEVLHREVNHHLADLRPEQPLETKESFVVDFEGSKDNEPIIATKK